MPFSEDSSHIRLGPNLILMSWLQLIYLFMMSSLLRSHYRVPGVRISGPESGVTEFSLQLHGSQGAALAAWELSASGNANLMPFPLRSFYFFSFLDDR